MDLSILRGCVAEDTRYALTGGGCPSLFFQVVFQFSDAPFNSFGFAHIFLGTVSLQDFLIMVIYPNANFMGARIVCWTALLLRRHLITPFCLA